jgi:uncharacterized coiled-coil protein SlyX
MEERMDRLEMKIAFLEDAVATLNELVIRQSREYEVLTASVKRLESKFAEFAELAGEPAKADRRPPHY